MNWRISVTASIRLSIIDFCVLGCYRWTSACHWPRHKPSSVRQPVSSTTMAPMERCTLSECQTSQSHSPFWLWVTGSPLSRSPSSRVAEHSSWYKLFSPVFRISRSSECWNLLYPGNLFFAPNVEYVNRFWQFEGYYHTWARRLWPTGPSTHLAQTSGINGQHVS